MDNITQNEGERARPSSALGALAQHVNWDSVPVERPAEGIERQMVVGQNLMLCRFRFAPNLVTPEHSHPHEQMS
ncbi:MAG TPA: hypothetical protein VNZ44_20200, partial [Pyrinomonadaceae bacterium]|nr:hypothetical protein [Pyrinomonadaceae bacterium]